MSRKFKKWYKTYFFLDVMQSSKLISYDFLSLEKLISFHDVIILIKSVLDKDQNHHYYNIFLEKSLYQSAKK